MDLGLQGKRALVTASSKGIGYAVAARLIAEGADVVISSRAGETLSGAEKSLREHAPRGESQVYAIAADLTGPSVGTDLVESATERLGGLDILISNTPGPRIAPVLDFTDEDWDGAYRTLLRPAVQLTRAAAKHMAAQGSGSIVLLTSTWVKQPAPGGGLSAAYRSALSALGKQLAIELAASGVRVNQVMPGATGTDRMQNIAATKAAHNGTTIEQEIAEVVSAIPIGRWADPQEIADAVAFIASPRSGFTTGHALALDGGAVRGIL